MFKSLDLLLTGSATERIMDLVQVTCCPSENSKYKNESAVAFIWLDQFKVRPIDWGNIEGKFGTLRSEDLSSLYLLSVSSCYLLFALVFIHSFIHSFIHLFVIDLFSH